MECHCCSRGLCFITYLEYKTKAAGQNYFGLKRDLKIVSHIMAPNLPYVVSYVNEVIIHTTRSFESSFMNLRKYNKSPYYISNFSHFDSKYNTTLSSHSRNSDLGTISSPNNIPSLENKRPIHRPRICCGQ